MGLIPTARYVSVAQNILCTFAHFADDHKLDKRDDLQTVNRTVGIVVGVLLGVFLIIVLVSLYICRCTCMQRHYRSRDRPIRRHRRLRMDPSHWTSQTISSRGEGRSGELGLDGRPGWPGGPGGNGEGVVGGKSFLKDKIFRYDSDNSAVRGSSINEKQDNGNSHTPHGGTAIGGSAHGGLGGQGGSGGQGGAGGCGGPGGRASARAEAYASVYALMMCCVQVPRKSTKGRTHPTILPSPPGPIGPQGVPPPQHHMPPPLHMPPPHPQHGPMYGGGGTHIDRIEGGVGSGGNADGGKGGHGGAGGLGGRGGAGGLGGHGSAHASASTPIYPGLMCCVLVKRYS